MELSTTVMFQSLNSSANKSVVDVADNSSVNFNTSVISVNESYNNESELSPPGLSYTNPYGDLARLLHAVIIPILFVFGTYGNAVSFYIMRRGSLKEAWTCFYMAILAVADTREYIIPLSCDNSYKPQVCHQYVAYLHSNQ